MTSFSFRSLSANPEFRRNLWLEINTGRLVGMAVIVLSIAFLAATVGKELEGVTIAAIVMYNIIVNLWGTKLAIDSVIDEVNGRTWIYQQMTPLSPWKMALGKLFGATIFAWYGGALCAALLILAGLGMGEAAGFAAIPGMVLDSVTLHAAGMILALVLIRRVPTGQKVRASGIYLIVLFSFSSSYSSLFLASRYSRVFDGLHDSTVHFWGIPMSGLLHSMILTCFCLTWAMIGLRQAMRIELQFQNDLKRWFLFVGTLIFIALGEIVPEEGTTLGLYLAAAAALTTALAFALVLVEPKLEIEYRKALAAWKSKRWTELQHYAPLWAATLPVALGFSVLASLLLFVEGESSLWKFDLNGFFPLALAMFLIRDIAIVLWVNFSSSKRPDPTSLMILALLHFVMPAILGASAGWSILNLLNPIPGDGAVVSFVSGMAQAAFSAAMANYAWGQALPAANQ